MVGTENTPALSSWIGLVGCALLPATGAVTAARGFSRSLRIPLFGAVFLLALLPVHGLPLAGHLRGLTGDLSITTLVLLSVACLSGFFGRSLSQARSLRALLTLVLLAGLALYPFALGLTRFDPYAFGYSSRAFLGILLGLTVTSWLLDLYWVGICLTAAVLARSMAILESRNLWDYLIDPLLFLYATAWSFGWVVNRAWAFPRSGHERTPVGKT